MQPATQAPCVNDSWQTPRNARTVRNYMALRTQEIGARLRELRGERPQTLVADELGIAERTLQGWELGEAKPSYRNLQKLATYFGVGEDYILTGERRGHVPASTPEPVPTRRNGGEDTLTRIEARLDDHAAKVENMLAAQTRALQGIESLLARIEAAISVQEAAASREDASRERLLAAADDAARALRDATRLPAAEHDTQAK